MALYRNVSNKKRITCNDTMSERNLAALVFASKKARRMSREWGKKSKVEGRVKGNKSKSMNKSESKSEKNS